MVKLIEEQNEGNDKMVISEEVLDNLSEIEPENYKGKILEVCEDLDLKEFKEELSREVLMGKEYDEKEIVQRLNALVDDESDKCENEIIEN